MSDAIKTKLVVLEGVRRNGRAVVEIDDDLLAMLLDPAEDDAVTHGPKKVQDGELGPKKDA